MKYIIIKLICLLTLSITNASIAALPTDPTRPDFNLLNTTSTHTIGNVKNKSNRLQAIMFNSRQKIAIIDNKSYQEKQWLNAETQLIKITPKAVILNRNGEQKTISLNTVQIKTVSKLDNH